MNSNAVRWTTAVKGCCRFEWTTVFVGFSVVLLACLASGSTSTTNLVSAHPHIRRQLLFDYYNDDPDEEDEGDEEEVAKTYHINSKGEDLTVHVGSTITLPCALSEPGGVAQWRLENAALWLGSTKQTKNERLSRRDDNSLVIKGVQQSDVGNYSCQLLQEPPYNEIISHYVHVYNAPKIVRTVPVNRTLVVSAGSPLTLMCEAQGHPKPNITWTSRVTDLKIDDESVRIDKLTGRHTGNYTCTATNSEGTDKRTLQITVEYAPEIHIEKEMVNSAEGYESELKCIVDANPDADVTWSKEGTPKKTLNHRVRHIEEGNEHILRISPTKVEDFGNYTCTSHNDKGFASKSISLTGIPLTPVFIKSETTDTGNTKLTWGTESRADIVECEIFYKKQEASNWTAEPVKDVENVSENHRLTHIFNNLEIGTYQAMIRAKNKYGWSQVSAIKSFSGPQTVDKAVGQGINKEGPVQGSGATELRISSWTITLGAVTFLLSQH